MTETATPAAYPTVCPMLTAEDPAAAIAFYESVFGAARRPPTLTGPDGTILHAEMLIGEALVMVGPSGAPGDVGGGAKLNLVVTDADAVAARAVAAGAEMLIPVADQFYGHRSGRLRDPFGHVWVLSQVLERLDETEMQRRLDAAMAAP